MFSKVHICDSKVAYLDDIANLEILPYCMHFSEVMSFTKIIKDVGCYKVMVPLPECEHIAKSLQDESDRGLINYIVKVFKLLDNI